MEHPHYLLRDVLLWRQNGGLALASGALNSFEKNALANFWRDIGNVVTGAGAGWTATRDSVFNLFGVNLPASQPQSGDDAVRNTIGSFLQQIFEGTPGSTGTNTAPSSSQTTPASNYTSPPLEDLLPPEMGGKTTLADVVAAAKNNPPEN